MWQRGLPLILAGGLLAALGMDPARADTLVTYTFTHTGTFTLGSTHPSSYSLSLGFDGQSVLDAADLPLVAEGTLHRYAGSDFDPAGLADGLDDLITSSVQIVGVASGGGSSLGVWLSEIGGTPDLQGYTVEEIAIALSPAIVNELFGNGQFTIEQTVTILGSQASGPGLPEPGGMILLAGAVASAALVRRGARRAWTRGAPPRLAFRA